MLTCHQLNLHSQYTPLVSNLSISIMPGSLVYLRGNNGSGKSSLLRVFANIQSITSGHVKWYGDNITNVDSNYCTYIGHKLAIKPELTVREHLLFWGTLYNSIPVIDAAIHYFSLYNILEKPSAALSEGMKKKLALSRLLLSNNDLWLLDEIDSNLDKQNLALLQNCITSKLNTGGVVVIASHQDAIVDKPQELILEDF